MRPLSPRRALALRLFVMAPALVGTAFILSAFFLVEAGQEMSRNLMVAGLLVCGLCLLPLPFGYLGLSLALLCWLPLVSALIQLIGAPIWVSGPLYAALLMLPFLALYRLGRDAGNRRYRAMSRRGRPMQEVEWVPTGQTFARSHRYGRLNWAIGLVALCLALLCASAVINAVTTPSLLFALIAAFEALALIAVLRKWGGGSWLVSLALLPVFPITAPLLMYWADGTRPNLIYRARFARLRDGHDPETAPW